jgi:hypothetical protein
MIFELGAIEFAIGNEERHSGTVQDDIVCQIDLKRCQHNCY